MSLTDSIAMTRYSVGGSNCVDHVIRLQLGQVLLAHRAELLARHQVFKILIGGG